MTPGARLAAAIEVFDRIIAGEAAERALTNWGRRSRFAGSGDRAAVRDLAFGALRCRRSWGALGGGDDGRAVMLGGVLERGEDPETLFSGAGHAPALLTAAERSAGCRRADLPEAVARDCPDWLVEPLRASLGAAFPPVMAALRRRAPVFLRVNTARTTRAAAVAALGDEGIAARPVELSPSALEVTGGGRKLRHCGLYRSGLVELQDAASQAVVDALPLGGGPVLDYCAGGGGKTLAMAARAEGPFLAHDADPGRMRDLEVRAARAGVAVRRCHTADEIAAAGPYALVLLDVPCSGSGSWRRAPQGKWDLTPERLRELTSIQDGILRSAQGFVARDGWLAYVTCSLLEVENRARVASFLDAVPGWRLDRDRRFSPLDGGDGFYLALLRRTGS